MRSTPWISMPIKVLILIPITSTVDDPITDNRRYHQAPSHSFQLSLNSVEISGMIAKQEAADASLHTLAPPLGVTTWHFSDCKVPRLLPKGHWFWTRVFVSIGCQQWSFPSATSSTQPPTTTNCELLNSFRFIDNNERFHWVDAHSQNNVLMLLASASANGLKDWTPFWNFPCCSAGYSCSDKKEKDSRGYWHF